MSILSKIIEVKKREIEILKDNSPISLMKGYPHFAKPTVSFSQSISVHNRISIIAEIKQASPSKGILCDNFNHRNIAKSYIHTGVNAISILTDKEFFKGDISFLKDISIFSTIPLLRKDFILDEHQIWEARANGSSAILLISEILSAQQIKELTICAKELSLDVLLELHSISELDKIDFTLNNIIGINNRNLDDFSVDLNTSFSISKELPKEAIKVSESGIHNYDQLKTLYEHGFNAVLVGEHFMKSDNLEESIKQFISWSRFES
jgi:indole-3-glycerol phosphate synthase